MCAHEHISVQDGGRTRRVANPSLSSKYAVKRTNERFSLFERLVLANDLFLLLCVS